MNNLIKSLQEEKEQLNTGLTEVIELLDSLKSTTYKDILDLQEENKLLKEELDKSEKKFKLIEDICNQINITIAGGEASPKDEWINLYMQVTRDILSIVRRK